MDRFLEKWQWKWAEHQATREVLYMFQNEKRMILEVKEKRENGEKCCQWVNFDKVTGKIVPMQFKSMQKNKREFIGASIEWNQTKAVFTSQNHEKEVLQVKMSKK